MFMFLGALCHVCWGKRGTQEAEHFIHTCMHEYTNCLYFCVYVYLFIFIYFGQIKQNIYVHSLNN
jgi:hypothetical protein